MTIKGTSRALGLRPCLKIGIGPRSACAEQTATHVRSGVLTRGWQRLAARKLIALSLFLFDGEEG